MADVDTLYTIYEKFCNFGSNRNLSQTSGSQNNVAGPTMDGAKFAKFCRDANLVDKTIALIDIDITFNKVKGKTARKINFDEFQEALKLFSRKKYPSKSPTEAYVQLVRAVAQASVAPTIISNVKPVQTNIVERLTDPSNFTGTQKTKFETNGLSKSHGSLNNVSSPRSSTTTPSRNKRVHSTVATTSSEMLDKQSSTPKKTEIYKPVTPGNKNSGVFNRLTDTSQYTGSHKHRFDEHGNGRGLEGRDTPSKGSGSGPTYHRGGNVHSLAQILRS